MSENLSLWEQLNTASIKKLRTLLYEELNSLNEYIKNYKIKLGIIGDISKSRTPLGFGNLIKDLKLLLKISSSEEKENEAERLSLSQLIHNIISTINNDKDLVTELRALAEKLEKLRDCLRKQEEWLRNNSGLDYYKNREQLTALVHEESEILFNIKSVILEQLMPEIEKVERDYESKVRIELVSRYTLKEAVELLTKVFPWWVRTVGGPPWIGLRASMGIFPYVLLPKVIHIDFVKYWVAVYKGHVLGVSGIYTDTRYPDTVFGAWWGINPSIKDTLSRAGALLFEKAYREALKLKRRYLRIDTTAEYKSAFKIYQRIGFKIEEEYDQIPINKKIKYWFKSILNRLHLSKSSAEMPKELGDTYHHMVLDLTKPVKL